MAEQNTQMDAMGIKRYSNEQAKRITQECIEIALIQLLEQKEMEKISISEIVKKAGVSRTAFYSHYTSKEDVLKNILGTAIVQIDSLAVGDLRSEQYWESLFTEIGKIAKPFRLLLKADMGSQILSEITERIVSTVPDDLLHQYNEIFWVGAIYNVLIHWIMAEKPEPPKRIAKICVKIINFQLTMQEGGDFT